jgi:hypothetical protein
MFRILTFSAYSIRILTSACKKIEKKPWFQLFCDFLMTFYLWRLVQMLHSVCNRQKKTYFVGILKATDEKSRIRIRKPVHGSKDPCTCRLKMSRIRNTGLCWLITFLSTDVTCAGNTEVCRGRNPAGEHPPRPAQGVKTTRREKPVPTRYSPVTRETEFSCFSSAACVLCLFLLLPFFCLVQILLPYTCLQSTAFPT